MSTKKRASEFQVLGDRDSHARAMSLPIAEAVGELVEMLGLSLVAVIGGLSETRAVQQWTTGREPQRPQVLRFAFQLALMITEGEDGSVARSWFQGSNPLLGDRSPALMLHSRDRISSSPRLSSHRRASNGCACDTAISLNTRITRPRR